MMKKLIFIFFVAASMVSCSGMESLFSRDGGQDDSGSGSGKGSVSISGLSADYSKITGLYNISATVSASGVSADEIKQLGIMASTNSSAESNTLRGYVHNGLSGTCHIRMSTLSGNTTYYVKAFLTTSSGTVYSQIKTVRTPSK